MTVVAISWTAILPCESLALFPPTSQASAHLPPNGIVKIQCVSTIPDMNDADVVIIVGEIAVQINDGSCLVATS
jgi:hypothetical protein